MGAYAAGSTHHNTEFGLSGVLRLCKQILNAAAVAADRSDFAALPARLLDDIGITEADRAAILGYAEPTTDGWRIIASHL